RVPPAAAPAGRPGHPSRTRSPPHRLTRVRSAPTAPSLHDPINGDEVSQPAMAVIDADPYVRSAGKVLEPPRGWRPSLRFLGPGMGNRATVIGTGGMRTANAL